jgi:NADPH-dependent curcumin reductase CurA
MSVRGFILVANKRDYEDFCLQHLKNVPELVKNYPRLTRRDQLEGFEKIPQIYTFRSYFASNGGLMLGYHLENEGYVFKHVPEKAKYQL